MSKLTTLPARFLNSWVKLCTGREMQEALDEEHYRQQILVITSLFWLLTVLAVTVAIRVFIDLSPEGVVAATALLLSTSLSVLACILILSGQGMAVARGSAPASGEMVLCIGAGSYTVFVDGQGRPTAPPHLCQDCLQGMDHAALPDVFLPGCPVAVSRSAPLVVDQGRPASHPMAVRVRGPPLLS